MIMGGFWSFSFQLLNPKPARSHSYNWTKISSWNFWIKNDGEKWSRIFYFEIQRAPSELLLSKKSELAWQVSLKEWNLFKVFFGN